MENYSYNSSHDSSPRSREIDCDQNASWDDPPPPPPLSSSSNYKVKFMCSYGGKIHPRPHDNQLAYVGGDTKILSVDRNIRFSGIISKLSALCDFDVCFKYQLPGEDLDALISVTNEEDLEHMMIEYDRLHRGGGGGGSVKPARLRLFLFPLINPSSCSPTTSLSDNESSKSNQQWFVDALNSVPIGGGSLDSSSSPPAQSTNNNPDFLFGLEKNNKPSPMKPELVHESSIIHEPIPVVKLSPGSDSVKEDRYIIGVGGEQAAAAAAAGVSPAEIQRQIQELQRLQMANHEQAMFQRKTDEMLARAFPGDYYVQKVPSPTTNVPVTPAPRVHSPAPSPATMPVPTGYWQQQQDNRHVATGGVGGGGGYPPAAAAPPPTGSDQPVYIIPAPGPLPPNMYHHPHPHPHHPPPPQMNHQIPLHQPPPQQHHQQQSRPPVTSQGYYGMQRMVVPEHVYREQPVYGHNMGPAPPPQQPTKLMGGGGGGAGGGGYGAPVPASGIPVAETGYAQVAHDSTGRQVYFTSAPGGVVLPPPPSLPPTTATYHPTSVPPPPTILDGRQEGGGGGNNKVLKQVAAAASPV